MSEIKQINTGVAELLAVKVPEKSCWFETRPGQGIAPPVLVYNFGPNKFMSEVVHLPPGNWTPLGLSTELTTQQCRDVMPSILTQGDKAGRLVYRDWTFQPGDKKHSHVSTAKEAFASLMQANRVYSSNPYGDSDATEIRVHKGQEEVGELLLNGFNRVRREAEANTGTWLILKRLS